jgi:hypothetical protein
MPVDVCREEHSPRRFCFSPLLPDPQSFIEQDMPNDHRGARERSTNRFCFAVVLSAVVYILLAPQVHAQSIAFVQAAYAVPQSPQATVTVRYPGAQTAGNLNVVLVGWNDATSQVASVSDASGNVYTRAVGPTVQPGIHSQAIYYAAGIAGAAANSNVVTVTFSTAVSYPDVRIVEYRGIDPANPLDSVAGTYGTSGTSNTGTLTTRSANTLLVAGNYVQTSTRAAGAGFTRRVITTPAAG